MRQRQRQRWDRLMNRKINRAGCIHQKPLSSKSKCVAILSHALDVDILRINAEICQGGFCGSDFWVPFVFLSFWPKLDLNPAERRCSSRLTSLLKLKLSQSYYFSTLATMQYTWVPSFPCIIYGIFLSYLLFSSLSLAEKKKTNFPPALRLCYAFFFFLTILFALFTEKKL